MQMRNMLKIQAFVCIKWRSAMLPCGLALVNSLLAIVAPGQSYVREVAH